MRLLKDKKFDLKLEVKKVKISQKQLHDILIKDLKDDKPLEKFAKEVLSMPNGKVVEVDEFEFELDSNARTPFVQDFEFSMKLIKPKVAEKKVEKKVPKQEPKKEEVKIDKKVEKPSKPQSAKKKVDDKK